MENKKFKVALFMLPLLTQGAGAEKYFIELAKNFRDKGVEADVITMDEDFFRKFARLLHIFTRGNFFGKIDISGRERESAIRDQLGRSRWLKASYKDLGKTLRNYDVIYSKNEVVDLILLKIIGYKKLPPIVVGVHTPISYPETRSFNSKLHNCLYASFFYKWLIGGAKCVHVSNSSALRVIDKEFKLKSELIYYPFSIRQILDSAKKNKCDIEFDADKKNFIFVGRLGEQKGIDVLIKIIRKISGNKVLAGKTGINIFGSGDEAYQNAIKKMAEENSFVRYFGHVEHKFMPDILSRQDLLVAPSKWETLPYVILEAQGMGLPVIAFDIPGPSDIMIDGLTGFLVKNEEEFIEKTISIVQNEVKFSREEITKNIEKKFDPDIIYGQLLDMFEDNL